MRPPATQTTELMYDGDQAEGGTSEHPQRRQFSIFSILELVAISATLFAAWRQFPDETKWISALPRSIGWTLFLTMVLFLVVLLFLVSAATWLIGRTISSRGDHLTGEETPLTRSYLFGVFRFLGLDRSLAQPSVVSGVSIALASSATLILLWPAIRELGLVSALSTLWGFASTRDWASYAIPDALGDLGHWQRVWRWELWSLCRWWLLFGGTTAIWTLVAVPFQKGPTDLYFESLRQIARVCPMVDRSRNRLPFRSMGWWIQRRPRTKHRLRCRYL